MGVLMLLATICGLILAAILFVAALWAKKTWLRKFVLASVAVWFVFYTAMLFGFSLTSKETVLEMNQPKEFCGFYLDCHLHTSVSGVRSAKQIGTQTANGTFYIVNVKVFSDARNPNINFRLLEPKAEIQDEGGRIYTRIPAAESQLPTAQTQLNQDIKGSETVEKEIVFDITEPAKDLKLSITEGYGIDKIIEAILVNDEDSILHQPTVFRLETQNQMAGD